MPRRPGPLRRGAPTLAAALALTGGSLISGCGRSASSSHPPTAIPSARGDILAAVDLAAAARSADVTVQFSAQGGPDSETATGSGAVDFANQSSQLQLGVSNPQGAFVLPVRYVGGTLYEAVPDLDQLERGKTWVSFGQSASSTGQSGSALGAGGNPSTLLSLFSQPAAQVTPAGPTSVNGIATNGYWVTFTSASLRHLRGDTHLPSALQSTLSQDITDLSANVQLDHSGQLVENDLSITVDGPYPVTITESLDFSDYGVPTNIASPPAATVIGYQEFLKDAQGGAGQLL